VPLLDGFPGVSEATDFDELRALLAGQIVRDAAGVPRAGLFPGDYGSLITGRADLKFNVADFRFAGVRGSGVIFGANRGVTVVDPPAIGLPSANSRIDILWARQRVAASPLSDGSDVPEFFWTTGTASATPQPPSTPPAAGAVKVGTVRTAFNTTQTNDGSKVTITPSDQFTAAAGGAVPFRTLSSLQLWTTAAERQKAVVFGDSSDLNGDYAFIGGSWVSQSASGTDTNGWSWVTLSNGKRLFYREFSAWSGAAFGPQGGSNWTQTRQAGIAPPTGVSWDAVTVAVSVYPRTAANGLQFLIFGFLTQSTGSAAANLVFANPTAATIPNTNMDLKSAITLIEK
jgi:hypothetical protein